MRKISGHRMDDVSKRIGRALKWHSILFGSLAFAAVPGYGQTPPPQTAPSAKQSLQADFDAASAAVEQGHCADAEQIFARLAVDPRVKPGSLPAAMIALRRGLCHIRTGDAEQGEAWVRAGLPVVEQAGPGLAADALLGWLGLAQLATLRHDHDGAVTAFHRALAIPGMATRVDVLMGLAMITAFDGDGVALETIDRALAIEIGAPGDSAKGDHIERRRNEAAIRVVRTRTLMDMGRYAEALKEGEKALSLSGGLTEKVTLNDVSLRADVAQAALLTGNKDRARKLLAYTGAGRIAESPFASAKVMRVPDCDDSVGMRPDDSAVVEFSIADNGTVEDAQTVFTRGNYATARAFGEAVRSWVWQPEKVARLPAFYRALIRVELRCSKSGGGLPSVTAPFRQRVAAWSRPLLAQPYGLPLGGPELAVVRQRAAALETAGDGIGAGTLIALTLLDDPVARRSDLVDADHAATLLAGADPARRASVAAVRALSEARMVGLYPKMTNSFGLAREGLLLKAAQQPMVAADALAQDTLRLYALTENLSGRFDEREVAVLHEVADDTRLDAASPLRQVAVLRLASIAARDGRRAEAEALFARTGLSEEQCSLIGDIPRLKSSNFDQDYPVEAIAMGVEGWVREEFDIAADGRTASPRTIIAYPPFVFVEGAAKLISSARFDTSFRPSGKTACSARSETINFNLPYKH